MNDSSSGTKRQEGGQDHLAPFQVLNSKSVSRQTSSVDSSDKKFLPSSDEQLEGGGFDAPNMAQNQNKHSLDSVYLHKYDELMSGPPRPLKEILGELENGKIY